MFIPPLVGGVLAAPLSPCAAMVAGPTSPRHLTMGSRQTAGALEP